MGKRSGDRPGGAKTKRQKVSGFIDPNTRGIYATCNRGREQQCRKELMNLFSEKIETYFDVGAEVEDDDDEATEEPAKVLSVEEKIQQELDELKETKDSKKELLKPIELGCECLVFIKTRKPIVPEILVERLCTESLESKIKTTRFTQKLSPVTYSVTPTIEELKKLAKLVLAPHFHKEQNQKPYRFAIQVSKRNFNALPKGDIIKTIAECVGREHGHSVDLKKYDKLIILECYKSNIGMSVVNDYLKLEKFNLQQIFEKNSTGGGESRVKPKKKEQEKEEKEAAAVTETATVTETEE